MKKSITLIICKVLGKILPRSYSFKLEQQFLGPLQFKEWEMSDKSQNPPHIVKQLQIRNIQNETKYKILIETGTYRGDMVEAQIPFFDTIYSIELSKNLYLKACKRFKGTPKVKLFQGDSSLVLGKITKNLDSPAIFWLDGHYSGGITAKGESECPIIIELNEILSLKIDCIIMIDDARCFIGQGDYPSIAELSSFFKSKGEEMNYEIQYDCIIIKRLINGDDKIFNFNLPLR